MSTRDQPTGEPIPKAWCPDWPKACTHHTAAPDAASGETSTLTPEEMVRQHIVEIGWNERVAQAACGCRVYRETRRDRQVLLLRPCGAEAPPPEPSDGRHLPPHAVLWCVLNGRICRKRHAPNEPHEWETAVFTAEAPPESELSALREEAHHWRKEALALKQELTVQNVRADALVKAARYATDVLVLHRGGDPRLLNWTFQAIDGLREALAPFPADPNAPERAADKEEKI